VNQQCRTLIIHGQKGDTLNFLSVFLANKNDRADHLFILNKWWLNSIRAHPNSHQLLEVNKSNLTEQLTLQEIKNK